MSKNFFVLVFGTNVGKKHMEFLLLTAYSSDSNKVFNKDGVIPLKVLLLSVMKTCKMNSELDMIFNIIEVLFILLLLLSFFFYFCDYAFTSTKKRHNGAQVPELYIVLCIN